MTRISLFLSLFCAVIALCTGCGDDAVAVECTDGSGTIATEQRSAGTFSGIVVSDNIRVVLQQGSPDVQVEADNNFLQHITTELRGTRLYIGVSDDACLHNGTATVYVTAPQLQSISTEGSGDITGTATFSPESFTVTCVGSGSVQVTGATTKAVSIAVQGSGNVQIKGRATTLTAQISGSGSLYAYELPVQDAILTLTGSGNAEVNTAKTLDVKLTGSGSVTYIGSPVVSSVITGSGTVKKKP